MLNTVNTNVTPVSQPCPQEASSTDTHDALVSMVKTEVSAAQVCSGRSQAIDIPFTTNKCALSNPEAVDCAMSILKEESDMPVPSELVPKVKDTGAPEEVHTEHNNSGSSSSVENSPVQPGRLKSIVTIPSQQAETKSKTPRLKSVVTIPPAKPSRIPRLKSAFSPSQYSPGTDHREGKSRLTLKPKSAKTYQDHVYMDSMRDERKINVMASKARRFSVPKGDGYALENQKVIGFIAMVTDTDITRLPDNGVMFDIVGTNTNQDRAVALLLEHCYDSLPQYGAVPEFGMIPINRMPPGSKSQPALKQSRASVPFMPGRGKAGTVQKVISCHDAAHMKLSNQMTNTAGSGRLWHKSRWDRVEGPKVASLPTAALSQSEKLEANITALEAQLQASHIVGQDRFVPASGDNLPELIEAIQNHLKATYNNNNNNLPYTKSAQEAPTSGFAPASDKSPMAKAGTADKIVSVVSPRLGNMMAKMRIRGRDMVAPTCKFSPKGGKLMVSPESIPLNDSDSDNEEMSSTVTIVKSDMPEDPVVDAASCNKFIYYPNTTQNNSTQSRTTYPQQCVEVLQQTFVPSAGNNWQPDTGVNPDAEQGHWHMFPYDGATVTSGESFDTRRRNILAWSRSALSHKRPSDLESVLKWNGISYIMTTPNESEMFNPALHV